MSPLKNENKLDEDFYCTLHTFVLIRFIQRNQGHRDSVMHEFHSNVNKVNKAVAKVRTIGDRLPLIYADLYKFSNSLHLPLLKLFPECFENLSFRLPLSR